MPTKLLLNIFFQRWRQTPKRKFCPSALFERKPIVIKIKAWSVQINLSPLSSIGCLIFHLIQSRQFMDHQPVFAACVKAWEFVRIGRCSSVSLGDWLRIWKNWETLRHLLGAAKQHFFKASKKLSWDKKKPKAKIIFTCGESFIFTLRRSDITYTRVKYHKKLALCLRWQNI